jgi:PucR family transcriptional regulator, purine catabolism regulatory protein
VRREAATAAVAVNGSLAVALVPGLPEDELFALAERVAVGMASNAGSPVRRGVGRAVPVREIVRSLDEARFALEAKRAAREGGVDSDASSDPSEYIATYRDLGSYQLLLALQSHDALRRFCDSILGPIEAMENAYGGELLRSLQVFIEANGQWERAARQLFCHRHTLRYRIRKIEELTGRDLESAIDRIEFYLALRARTLLS